MKRSAALHRRAPLRKKKRTPSEFARIYGSKERVAWFREQPCIIDSASCSGRTENAHTETDGVGRKAGYEKIVPLCAKHHRELHRIGSRQFEANYDERLDFAAAWYADLWEIHIAWQARQLHTGTPNE